MTTGTLIGDDTSANLQALAGMLKEQGCKEKSFGARSCEI
jgi:hypothetical protein